MTRVGCRVRVTISTRVIRCAVGHQKWSHGCCTWDRLADAADPDGAPARHAPAQLPIHTEDAQPEGRAAADAHQWRGRAIGRDVCDREVSDIQPGEPCRL